MPIYTYSCTICNAILEKRQSFSDAPLTTCEQCGGTLRKVIHPVGIVFKGSGWYITDSRSSTASANATSNSSSDTAKSESTSTNGKASNKATSAAGTSSTTSSGTDTS